MPFSIRPFLLLLFLSSHLWMGAPTLAAAPNDVATVTAHLKRAESNLALVDGSIGHLSAPPKGSAAKLAKMRLDQAFGDLKPAGEILGRISGAGVAEAAERYNKAAQLYGKLQGILAGKPPEPKPTPKPTPTPKPAEKEPVGTGSGSSGTVKLGYPHADNFKNTLFTLRRVEGDTAGLVKLLEQLRPIEDQLEIDHRTTAIAMASIAEARRQAGFVRDGMAKIPANGEGVAEAQQRLVNADASLAAAEAYFQPLNARLLDLVNPASYPDFNKDVKRLRELSSAYGNPEIAFREQRTSAAEAFAQGEAAKAECVRLAKVYARLMQQKTEQGKQIEAAGNNFLSAHASFLAVAEQQKQALPGEIRGDLAEANRMAEEAIANQKPLWFSGGIPQRMEWVDDKFALYSALDPAGAQALQSEIDSVKVSIRAGADSLKELIIRENKLPADNYTGSDRETLVALATRTWKEQEPDFELLTVRIPSEAWTRETKWTYSNGTWYFVDKSALQVRLIVADKKNPAQAIDRPVNLRKDHQKGDTLAGYPFRTIDEPLQPSEYLLRSRVE